MAKHVCLNGTMVNTDVYSSPVPVIGLYIAVVSLVCFVLIVFDVWTGFRSKKLWFPCRFFPFNSITLTLISVATKIPVDLTTSMPSAQDQLAKLSGTVFICMTMSFMLPSISINAEFESYANVTALSIFVITVVVNICIQMATGVIFSFIAEHAIILFCMLFLLIRFWSSVTFINSVKRTQADETKNFMRKIRGSMFARLKLCYLYSYHSCLQLYSCRTPNLADVGIVCMVCSIILVQATVRSLGLKTVQACEGASDYGWSMWGVLVTQILTVAVVNLVTGLRSLNNIAHPSLFHLFQFPVELLIGQRYEEFRYLFSSKNLPKFLFKGFHYFIYKPVVFFDAAIALMTFAVHLISVRLLNVCGFLFNTEQEDRNLKKLRIELEDTNQVTVENWLLKKGVEDFERWLKINNRSSLEHLPALLSTVPPAEEPFVGLSRQGRKISSLSVVLIANAMMTMPSTLGTVNIANVLREAFEIIHFVDNTVNVQSSSDRLQSMLAKTIHKYGLLSSNHSSERLLEQILPPSPPELEEILFFRDLPTTAIDAIEYATRQISFFINGNMEVINPQLRQSNEGYYLRLETLFVNMLRAFLAQLPVAVYTHILESLVEEYHERVRLGVGFICKLQSLDTHITFSLPSGCNITSLFENHQTSATNMPAEDIHMQVQGTTDPTTSSAVESVGEIQEDEHAAEQRV